ncbi:MAG TPA: hypothetical protein VF449_09195 [Parvibaculum sp.]
MIVAGAIVFGLALATAPAFADDATPAPAQQGDHFEIHDNADTAPVNYRSNEDKRYDTAKQHDAEMFAEQYEKQRADDALKQQKLINGMNRLSPSDERTLGGAGVTDAGFPSNRPF